MPPVPVSRLSASHASNPSGGGAVGGVAPLAALLLLSNRICGSFPILSDTGAGRFSIREAGRGCCSLRCCFSFILFPTRLSGFHFSYERYELLCPPAVCGELVETARCG